MSLDVSEDVRRFLESDCAHTLEPAARALDDDDDDARVLAQAVASRGDIEANTITRAIALLGRAGRLELIEALGEGPELELEDQRIAAADALGRLEDDRALPAITALSRAEGAQVRQAAVRALRALPRGAGEARLAEIARADPAPFVRRKASRMLEIQP